MSEEELEKRVEAILREIGKRDYLETLRAIDQLENDALIVSDRHAVALSCADLRLDAALVTGQSCEESEQRYSELISLGLDARSQLLKSVVFAKEVSDQKRRIVETHVAVALQRAHGESLPESLVEQAEQLLAAARRGEL
jgi:hypothetical protein